MTADDEVVPPLEDPDYDPAYKPVAGKAPSVIAKWGAASQRRWFERFRNDVKMTHQEWDQFFVNSSEHRGLCCESCMTEEEHFGVPVFDDHCCCNGSRAAQAQREEENDG